MILIDTLLLDPSQLQILCNKYNVVESTNLTNTSNYTQEYRISVELNDEEGYYNFLFDNWLSRTSTKFLTKLQSDLNFAERIRQRIEE